jgi:predicted glycoside hydrolase/deacetylase ChbG (UPF0249 family)
MRRLPRGNLFRAGLIVSADDFGIRPAATKRIVALAGERKIHRAAILITYAVQEVAHLEELKKTGSALDLHLELIRTLGGSERIDEHPIPRGIRFLRHIAARRIPHDAVRAEWRAQIELFRKIVGRLPDGLNSHEHVHFFPPFFKIFTELAEKYQIPYIRFSSQGIRAPGFRLTPAVLHACWRIDRRLWPNAKLTTSDFLVSFDWLRDPAWLRTLPPDRTIELIVHPEREDDYTFLSANTLNPS